MWKSKELIIYMEVGEVGTLQYLTQISTIVQLYCSDQFFGGGNRSTREKITDLSQVTDKIYHIMLYQVHLAMKRIRTYYFSWK